ncbi:unnamed protein product [Adineta steineri]|uniref:SARAH domain-containing protein n=1 Tax=Adineta steineri TaxID=433720 RepID=A0A814CY37_9BILA|nr:unnamed protein product [Adineta steineri]CAF0947521.1 unnamed protein product [Adineta steineri]
MLKKKQVTLQNSIPGKFIPRNVSSSGSAFPSGANDNRFNSKMAELLASSSSINDENEFLSTKSSQDNLTSNELISNDSSSIHSKLFHRRIVTMIEASKKPNNDLSATSSYTEQKSQPITFGQLRQATIASTCATIIDDKSISHSIITDTEDKHQKNITSFTRDNNLDLNSITLKSCSKYQTNKERLYYSPSLEQLFEQQNIISQTKKEEEEKSQQSSLTVDEILAMYYSKVNVPTNIESHLPSLVYPNNTTTTTSNSGFCIHSSVPSWNSSPNNQYTIPSPRLLSNDQNKIRPPPPSYLSSVTNSTYRMAPIVPNSPQHLIHSAGSLPVLNHLYPRSSSTQYPSNNLPNSTLSFSSILTNPTSNNSYRPPPPRYQSLTSNNIERSYSTLPCINDCSTSNQQIKTNNNNASAGFDREFSRLLYGKDAEKTRRKKQKRKAFSDPVKRSVEEAGRSAEKGHRRVTTHLNKTDTFKEEDDDDDEIESDRSINHKQELNLSRRRRFHRQSDLIEKTRESTKKSLPSINPSLKRRIPSFLRVYSQASSSNDILLQWHLFNLSELESFYTMITRLYKNENLARVQLYEAYRAALISAHTSKTSSNSNAISTNL